MTTIAQSRRTTNGYGRSMEHYEGDPAWIEKRLNDLNRNWNKKARHKKLGDWASALTSKDHTIRSKALSETIAGSEGGYLVPPELMTGIDSRLLERSLFHNRAFVIPMTSMEIAVPSVDLTTANASGTSPLFGGMILAFSQEGTATPQSEPTFQNCQLRALAQGALAKASNQLVDDGGEPLGAYLENIFARIILWTVERLCFQGTGTNQPLGIVNAPGTKLVARGLANTVSQVDLANMMKALIPACFMSSVWACSPSALASIVETADYVLNVGPSQENLAGYLYGRPIYVTENLPALGTKGDVLLFDPTLYVLGEREIEITSSRHYLFQNNQTAFSLLWRGDGQPLVKGTVTLADGSTTAGAYVALDVPTS